MFQYVTHNEELIQ